MTKGTKYKLEDFKGKEILVQLNPYTAMFYKDDHVKIIKEDTIKITPKSPNYKEIIKAISAGQLNIVDKDGNVLYTTIGIPRQNLKEFFKKELPKLTDDENNFVNSFVKASMATIVSSIEEKNNKFLQNKSIIKALIQKEQNTSNRKTVIAALEKYYKELCDKK